MANRGPKPGTTHEMSRIKREKIVTDISSGMNILDIAKKYDCHPSYVFQIRRWNIGKVPNPTNSHDNEMISTTRRLWDCGLTTRDIATIMQREIKTRKINRNVIIGIAHRHGFTPRNPTEFMKKALNVE